MNLSLNWLNDYVDVTGITRKDLIEKLTMSGSKVEKIKDLSEPLEKIVIGKVIEIKKHEDSDKLWICQIDVGDSQVQIVTGAQNVTEGAFVPVVLDGGVVLNRQDGSTTKIKKGKLRGQVSEGMLCSPDELGLDKSELPYADEDGILILSNDPEWNAVENHAGMCALEFLGLSDTIIEFEITNNRPDCLSIIGLAREVSATFDLPLNIPEPAFNGVAHDINKEVTVKVENTELCSRYMAGYVKNVKIGQSPRWLTSRLKAQGIRPINNIVDITNYVMLEYGNPLHAFDARFIDGNEIVVRNAKNKEEITLLDGNTVTLNPDVLVIADKSKPVAVAGVMGGEHSGVVDETVTVIFEAACFDGVSVRRAAKKITRRTESSSRFEKGLNPANVKLALQRALQLVEELGIGEVADTIVDCANFEDEVKTVLHDYEYVNKFLGTSLSQEEQVAIFKRLGLGYEDNHVVVPRQRSDIKLPCDLAEEVARIYGYNNIESTLPLLGRHSIESIQERGILRLANILTAQGCYECITYSFVSPDMADDDAVKIRNPFGEETSVMRTSMIPSMLKVIGDNIKEENTQARLFEIGRIYNKSKETDMLCIGLYGENEDFYTLSKMLEEILEHFNVNSSIERYKELPFHLGRAAKYDDYALFGEISPIVLQEYDIDESVYIAQIDIERLFNQSNDKIIYTPISRYPTSTRDLSLVCDEDVSSGLITEIILSNGKNLENVEFITMYDGSGLKENKQKCLSYKLIFRKPDTTLTGEEVDSSIKRILKKLEEQNIKIRA